MNVVLPLITAGLICADFASASPAISGPPVVRSPEIRPFAHIRLYNPTAWELSTAIEVPVGHLATPDSIDWSQIRLVDEHGVEVPFAIREGRPHWKATLTAPTTKPRGKTCWYSPSP